MKNKKRIAKRFGMVLLFSITYFFTLIATLLLIVLSVFIMEKFGLVNAEKLRQLPLFMLAVICILIGTIMSLVFSYLPLKPFYKIIEATDKIADGDYSVRLSLKGPAELKDLNNSFNNMAKELGSVEMLCTVKN